MVRLAQLLPYHTSRLDPIVRLQLKAYLDAPLWPLRVDSYPSRGTIFVTYDLLTPSHSDPRSVTQLLVRPHAAHPQASLASLHLPLLHAIWGRKLRAPQRYAAFPR
jgi:hypothetical protein